MLRAEEGSRQRMRLLGSLVLILLGGFALVGVVERILPSLSPDVQTSVPDMAAISAEARRAREARESLADLGRKHHWDAVVAAADDYLKKDNHPWIRSLRAEALFRLGKRAQAADDFTTLIGRVPIEKGSLLAFRGDQAAYQQECAETLRQLNPERASPSDANNAAWVCVVGPNGVSDYREPVSLAEQAVAGARPDERPLFLNTLGVALYRAGRDREAIARLTEAEKLHSDAFNWPFLALAYHRLGQEKEATQWLKQLSQRLDDTYGTPQQQDYRHELLLFWQEAENQVAARRASSTAAPP
jgi:tetratricopeptide (TPR) repeat protein